VHLTHKIQLDPTHKQRKYFVRAAGTHRFVFNWALAEWNRQYETGKKPNGNALGKQFNTLYPSDFPWIGEVHRDCHSRPFADLQRAFGNFFAGRADKPKFKRKNSNRPSFYIANDKLSFDDLVARLPIIGKVRMRESLRLAGKIIYARVVEECGEWFICISVDIGEITKERIGEGIVGVDLGIKTLATISTGEQVDNPKPLRKAQKRLRRASRKLSRRTKGSKNRIKQCRVIGKIHRRIRNIRRDVLHKLTTRLCRENQTVVIEDLNVSGMVKNHRLAQSINDASFGLFRTMLTYKSVLYGNRIVVADRFFPSSKKCSSCGHVKDKLSLDERTYQCEKCGLKIERDLNAALNLMQLGAACPEVTATDSHRAERSGNYSVFISEHTIEKQVK
jgi:putative transposase